MLKTATPDGGAAISQKLTREQTREAIYCGKICSMKGLVKTALVCVCAVVIFIIIINLVVIKVAEPLIVTIDEARSFAENGDVDCILVLGASVSQYGPSMMLADRLDKGMELFESEVSTIMLLSGDNGTIEYNEVQAMKEYVLKNGGGIGITSANIYLDHAGFSTYDSSVRCKDIFQAERIVIVTQRYHLYRAVYNAKMAGLDVVGVTAKDTKSGQTARDIREVPARVKDFFLALFSRPATIMGEAIPLTYPSTQ